MADDSSFDYSGIPPGFYDNVYRSGSAVRRFWHRYKFESVAALVPPDARTLLDIACGPGSMMSVLRRGELHRFGTDLAREQVHYARNQYGDESTTFCVSRLPELPFEDSSLDAVSLVEVIEHLPRTVVDESLREVRRVLRPGGAVILTTPNYVSIWPLLEVIVNLTGGVSYEEQHISKFTLRSARRLLDDSGFKVDEVSSFFTAAPFVAHASWKMGRAAHRFERRWARWTGALLLARAFKE